MFKKAVLEFTMTITTTYIHDTDQRLARAAILRPTGALDRSNYDDLIRQAVAARAAGAGHIIVDMRAVERVNTAGLVALYSVARLAHATPPDFEAGWAAIRTLAENDDSFPRLAIVNPCPSVRQTLARAPFSDFLAIHADLDTALATLAA